MTPHIPAYHDGKPHIPPTNAITMQLGERPEYPDNADELRYLILYPEDYQGMGSDVAGNVALLVNEDNAREVKRLAEQIIEELNDAADDVENNDD